MTTQKKPGGHWSAENPIPTIQKFVESLDRDKRERDRQIDEAAKVHAREERHNKHHAAEATPHKPSPTSNNRRRRVTDPTTGKEVEIDDVGKEFMKTLDEPKLTVPNANLSLPTKPHLMTRNQKVQTQHDQPFSEYKYNQDITSPPDPIAEGTTSDVPIHGEKTNILFHPTPSVSYEPMFKSLEKRGGVLCMAIFAGILIIGKISGASLKWMILLSCSVVSAVWLWIQDVIQKGRSQEWSSEKLRGQTATANLLPESVEWLNRFLEVAWGLLNPDMFASVADTIEDVMQASVPGIIENVRVAEIDQGSNPFRVLSLRALPESQATNLANGMREENLKMKTQDEATAEEEGGEVYNIECSFAYHAKPTGNTSSAKAENMHMMLVFYLGIKGLFGVPLPIFTELIEVVGTIRLRLQLTPQPPFAKTLTFSLMGLPHVRAGCVPMVKHGVNILNLPLISNFVNYAIGAAASLYVAPKSMTMDIAQLLQGDDIQKDTFALGILWVRVHRAVGLSKQDKRGSKGGGSDPYINLSFSKYGKPMYCTRVICDDLNPVWEESAALLVSPEIIKADEQLSIELWDSDRNTADDIVGKVELSVQKMIQHPGKMYRMVSKLCGMDVGSEMPGELHWEVGYFGKPRMRQQLRTDGKSKDLPGKMKDDPKLQDEMGNIMNEDQDAVMHTPPDPLWPSGICSIVVHQIVNLQFARIKGTLGNRKGRDYDPAREYGENTDEEGKDLPTSYCTIMLNDNLVYRTRAKAVSSKPIFNAGTERFIRDWRSALITIVVRDQRYRQHDPILGVVPLKLSNILQSRSQVTRWYPLDGGVGYGRIRVSLLFQSIETRLPRQLLGWDVGTFELLSDRLIAKGFNQTFKIKLRTSGSACSIPRSACHPLKDQSGFYVDLTSEALKHDTRLPVQHRYRSAVVLELHGSGSSDTGFVIIWLQDITDNETAVLNLPIWTTRNPQRLTQNFIKEDNCEQKRSPGLEDLTIVGRLEVSCRFSPGLSDVHESLVTDNTMRETYEAWEACIAEGVRGRKIVAEVPDHIKQLHEKALLNDIGGLGTQKIEKEEGHNDQWYREHGFDWSLAFGEDPSAIADFSRSRDDDSDDISESLQAESLDTQNQENVEKNDTSEPTTQANDSQRTDEDRNEIESMTTNTDSHAGDFETKEERRQRLGNKQNKRTEKRKLRGSMQWAPVRNAAFVKDEATFALKKVKNKMTGGLVGREPDIETEIG
ncbi:hypothetical protein LOZ07_003689 [Ophidiomyces ophidiicola]|nr:hypothetical protein LOZ60_004925 [Ophidiomyces ophidiicola]KAI2274246.1 hypothetical protein LOZ05_001583 [Ophidiomyces ophidiicola]KAI2295521.1 hypothetical protein LOZ07_003689 [Ophidiomyces ophidiicola]KAI2307678.1 hypothetical protein LOZ06_002971 [Ophidiomyces ophidiicola]KAI2406645.1 hypothetical protein LOY90_003581 [Ophidiomyces ophidiicola]